MPARGTGREWRAKESAARSSVRAVTGIAERVAATTLCAMPGTSHFESGAPISLSARGVTVRYAATLAVRDVSLDVAAGACVALVGESGSGKTTLLRCFNRMVTPKSGAVAIGGADVRELDVTDLRRHVGYVPQHGGLLPHWRVLRNAALVPTLLGDRKSVV